MVLGAEETLVSKNRNIPCFPRAYSETHQSDNRVEGDSSALKERKNVLEDYVILMLHIRELSQTGEEKGQAV